jgi:NAD(P)-dependent dehydrogenase (short-subunit alcohol dehydrogenase family)
MTIAQSYEGRRVALVTGAASGIGAATARSLAANGITVVGTDVDDAGGMALFADLGVPHQYRRQESWRKMVDNVVEDHGRLDIVHLNAGVMTRPKGAPLLDDPLEWMTVGGYRKVRDVNIDGVVYGIIAALKAPSLSHIVITSSGAAILPLQMDPYYTASKYAVLGLGLALEPSLSARGIRLDVLCPGAIDTGITAPDIRESFKQEPASFIGEAVATLLTSEERGPIWLAFSEEQGLRRYEPPGLPGMSAALDVVESAR